MYFDSKRYDTLVRAYRVLMAVAVLCGVYIITLLILSGLLGREHAGRILMGVDLFYDRA